MRHGAEKPEHVLTRKFRRGSDEVRIDIREAEEIRGSALIPLAEPHLIPPEPLGIEQIHIMRGAHKLRIFSIRRAVEEIDDRLGQPRMQSGIELIHHEDGSLLQGMKNRAAEGDELLGSAALILHQVELHFTHHIVARVPLLVRGFDIHTAIQLAQSTAFHVRKHLGTCILLTQFLQLASNRLDVEIRFLRQFQNSLPVLRLLKLLRGEMKKLPLVQPGDRAKPLHPGENTPGLLAIELSTHREKQRIRPRSLLEPAPFLEVRIGNSKILALACEEPRLFGRGGFPVEPLREDCLGRNFKSIPVVEAIPAELHFKMTRRLFRLRRKQKRLHRDVLARLPFLGGCQHKFSKPGERFDHIGFPGSVGPIKHRRLHHPQLAIGDHMAPRQMLIRTRLQTQCLKIADRFEILD